MKHVLAESFYIRGIIEAEWTELPRRRSDVVTEDRIPTKESRVGLHEAVNHVRIFASQNYFGRIGEAENCINKCSLIIYSLFFLFFFFFYKDLGSNWG